LLVAEAFLPAFWNIAKQSLHSHALTQYVSTVVSA